MSQRKEFMRPVMKKIRNGIPLTAYDKGLLRRQLKKARAAKRRLSRKS